MSGNNTNTLLGDGPHAVPQNTSKTDGDFPVLLVGAGFAMFGTPEGPWNLTRRLEGRLGARLRVLAVVEVDPARAEAALKIKADSDNKASYAEAVIVGSVAEFKKLVDAGKKDVPRAIVVATPPQFRGGLSSPRDLEIQLMDAFPESSIFLEKPVATGAPWEKSVEEAKEVGRRMREHKGVVSIGYVLRYLKAAQEMKRIIEENNLTVMATTVRWISAYPLAVKAPWWNNDECMGPVIEQATHICDLSRFFGGDIDTESIRAHAVEAFEKPGQLTKMGFDESTIPEDKRIPRATSASWKYADGGVGTMLHAIVLQGVDYSVELEVWADGYQMILADPYGTPTLSVRSPTSDKSVITPTPGDDPYQTEMDKFIDAVEGKSNDGVLSTYEDAAQTYEMTWHIRLQSEASTKQRAARASANGKQ